MSHTENITHILDRMREGHTNAQEQLYARVYRELKKIAVGRMRMERVGHTLQPTALVHEVYLRLSRQTTASFENKARFFAAAVGLMREILIDHARRKHADKRGGESVTLRLDDVQIASEESADDLLAVNDALERLSGIAPRQAKVVELRVFGGLTMDEIAGMFEIDSRTVARDWKNAQDWLRNAMKSDR